MTGLSATVAGFVLFGVVFVIWSLLNRAAPQEQPRPNDPGQLARGTVSCAFYSAALIVLLVLIVFVVAAINPV